MHVQNYTKGLITTQQCTTRETDIGRPYRRVCHVGDSILHPEPICSPDHLCCLCKKTNVSTLIVHQCHIDPYMFICPTCHNAIINSRGMD